MVTLRHHKIHTEILCWVNFQPLRGHLDDICVSSMIIDCLDLDQLRKLLDVSQRPAANQVRYCRDKPLSHIATAQRQTEWQSTTDPFFCSSYFLEMRNLWGSAQQWNVSFKFFEDQEKFEKYFTTVECLVGQWVTGAANS